jgi:hypothetical protein
MTCKLCLYIILMHTEGLQQLLHCYLQCWSNIGKDETDVCTNRSEMATENTSHMFIRLHISMQHEIQKCPKFWLSLYKATLIKEHDKIVHTSQNIIPLMLRLVSMHTHCRITVNKMWQQHFINSVVNIQRTDKSGKVYSYLNFTYFPKVLLMILHISVFMYCKSNHFISINCSTAGHYFVLKQMHNTEKCLN